MNDAAIKPHARGKVWFLLGGVVSILVGFVAMARPGLASIAITQVIGAFSLVSGVFLLASAIFGKANHHRLLDFLSSLLRMAVGILLLVNVIKGVLALTLVLASVFIAEGIVGAILAFKLQGKNPAWIWVLLNALVAILLGGMLFAKWPSDGEWAIGLLFGINSVFIGFSLLMYAFGLEKAEVA